MRSWVFAALPVVLAALLVVEYASIPAPQSSRALLTSLSRQLRFVYHGCVPLGWNPVKVAGTYYPGYTASAANYAEWLDAVWRGRIDKRDLAQPAARDVFATLNRLASDGLLTRTADARGYSYFMTPAAMPYYYGSSAFDDNRDSLPYLCYSAMVPRRIEWRRSIAPPRRAKTRNVRWYDVEFAWKPSAPAWWARSAFIRAHSVVLPPLTSPTTARVGYRGRQWVVANIYDRGWMMPAMLTGLRRTPR